MAVRKERRSHNENAMMFDPALGGAMVINTTDIETASVYDNLVGPHPEIAALVKWSMTNNADYGRSRQGGIWARDRYVTPDRFYQQVDVARHATTHDDIVSSVVESSESLAFNRINFFCDDPDEESIWDQIAYDIDLESRIREMWRELFIASQFTAVTWWGRKSYKVQGRSDKGVRRKKSYDDIVVPLGLTLLDPKKVVPVGNLMFNQEQLAYVADRTERDMLDAAVLNDPLADPLSRQIIVAKYEPPDYERKNLTEQGVNPDWLYILNPKNVWRHTLTRSQFQRWADVRMISIFELLDLKQQLKQMDRAFLLGGVNYLVLIKKGSRDRPGTPEEIAHLQASVSNLARVPVIVGDDRLSVEIVTPKMDVVLNAEKYMTIDARLQTRLYEMFVMHGTGTGGRGDDSVKMSKAITRGLESRRTALRRTLEREILGPCVLANDQLTSFPKMRFHPTHIQLELDPQWATLLLDVRGRGDISRSSYLNELDFDQDDEAAMREREKELGLDDIFSPTSVPFSNPNPDGIAPAGAKPAASQPKPDAKTAGRGTGGLKNGGGSSTNPNHGKSKDQQ